MTMKRHVRTAHPTSKMELREYDDGSLTIVTEWQGRRSAFKLHGARAAALKHFLSNSSVIA